MNINIRPAKKYDAEIIADFQVKMALETENYELNKNIVLKGVNAVFNDKTKGIYYVAEQENKIIASLLTTFEWSDWRNSTVIWIQSVFVLSGYRGKGIFAKMYKYIKNISVENKNYCGIRLYVDKTNLPAQKVYKKLGMESEHYKLFEDMNY